MKKVFATILALSMLVSLTACGGTTPPAASGSASSGAPAFDSKWPEREVRLIIPYGEGGGSHKTALIIKSVSEQLNLMKNPFIAVCMPNAATLEGQEEVLYADPDGYTALVHHNAMINGYALGKQDFSYDAFRMVGQIYETPLAIAVRNDFPADSMEEMVELIHANPGKYKWTWAGAGGNTHFASYVFYNAAGIDISEITPCITKGDSDSVVQCIGGTADIVIAQTNALEEYIKSGDLKVFGNSSDSSVTVAGQEIPSWTELGYDGVYNLRFFAFLPKETPDDVVNAVSSTFEKIVTSKEFDVAMAEQGMTARWLPEDEAIAAFAIEAESANQIAAQIQAEK